MKRHISIVFTLPVLGALLLLGCADDERFESRQVVTETAEFIPVVYPATANPAVLTREARNHEDAKRIDAEFVEIFRAAGDLRDHLMQSPDWQAAHRLVVESLTKYNGHRFVSYIEQIAANTILPVHLLNESDHGKNDRLETIGFYVTMLLNNKNPSAHTIYQSLRRLDGYWTPGEVATAASLAAGYSRDYLNRVNFAEFTGVDTNSLDKLADVQAKVHHQIHYAIPELEKMNAIPGRLN